MLIIMKKIIPILFIYKCLIPFFEKSGPKSTSFRHFWLMENPGRNRVGSGAWIRDPTRMDPKNPDPRR